MKINKQLTDLICELEYMVGSECYNPNSYDGYTGEEGREFRYPVQVYMNEDDEFPKKIKYKITDLEPSQVRTIKYAFGSNHLFIGSSLIRILKYLEKRYNLDFNELEKNRKTSR